MLREMESLLKATEFRYSLVFLSHELVVTCEFAAKSSTHTPI
jgi:hypothetical protein